MTRKELTDPFGSDDEEEPQVNNTDDVGNGVIGKSILRMILLF